MPDNTSPDAAAIDPRHEGAHPRDIESDQYGAELWNYVQEWRERWRVTDVELLWCCNQLAANTLRTMGKAEREVLDAKRPI